MQSEIQDPIGDAPAEFDDFSLGVDDVDGFGETSVAINVKGTGSEVFDRVHIKRIAGKLFAIGLVGAEQDGQVTMVPHTMIPFHRLDSVSVSMDDAALEREGVTILRSEGGDE